MVDLSAHVFLSLRATSTALNHAAGALRRVDPTWLPFSDQVRELGDCLKTLLQDPAATPGDFDHVARQADACVAALEQLAAPELTGDEDGGATRREWADDAATAARRALLWAADLLEQARDAA